MIDTPFSIGTYQIHGDASPILSAAWARKINYIDTAPNYRNGTAQKEINDALNAALSKGLIEKREDIFISTKVGFIPPQQIERLKNDGIISPQHTVHSHNIDPTYIRFQIQQNYEELGNQPLEYLFLHNPETQAQILDKAGLYSLIKEAFKVFEEAVEKGQIKGYGVATWNGFGGKEHDPNFSVKDLYNIANEIAGGRHHFKCIQLPISLVNSHNLALAIRKKEGPLCEAEALGINVHVSSPLHGGKLPKVMESALCEIIGPGLSPAQACLVFAKSHPSITRVLTSPSTLEQLEDTITSFEKADLPIAKLESIINLFKS